MVIGTHSVTAVFTPTDQVAYRSSTSPAESLTVKPPIITGLPISIDSLLQSVLGGLPGGMADLGPAHLNLNLPPVFGGAAGLDPGQVIQSVLGGQHR